MGDDSNNKSEESQKLVKRIELSKKDGKVDPKLSSQCICIIVVVFVFYYLGNLFSSMEGPEPNNNI